MSEERNYEEAYDGLSEQEKLEALNRFSEEIEEEAKQKNISRKLCLIELFLEAQDSKKLCLEAWLYEFPWPALEDELVGFKPWEKYDTKVIIIDGLLENHTPELPRLDFMPHTEVGRWSISYYSIDELVERMKNYLEQEVVLVDRKYLLPIKDLAIGPRSFNCLRSWGIEYAYQLVEMSPDEVEQIKNMTKGERKRIENSLKKEGLTLGGEISSTDKQAIDRITQWVEAVKKLLETTDTEREDVVHGIAP